MKISDSGTVGPDVKHKPLLSKYKFNRSLQRSFSSRLPTGNFNIILDTEAETHTHTKN